MSLAAVLEGVNWRALLIGLAVGLIWANGFEYTYTVGGFIGPGAPSPKDTVCTTPPSACHKSRNT